MSGCVKLFPVSPIASADLALQERERDLQKRFGRDAKLNTWDQKAREAINAFYGGTMTEGVAMAVIQGQAQAKAAWRARRNRRY